MSGRPTPAKQLTLDIIAEFTDKKGKLMVNKSNLARMLMARHSGIFPNFNAARGMVRRYTGASGEQGRKETEKQQIMTRISTVKEGLTKAGIVTKHTSTKPVRIPPGKYLVLSDIHIPFQHDEALATALQYGIDEKVTGIILNGDIMDCYQVSRFLKNLDRPTVEEELVMVGAFLDYLKKIFPTQKIWYKFGNHEERMNHYILQNARELAKVPGFDLESMLKLKERGIKMVGIQPIKAGKLNILHGHELGKGIFSPVNPARGTFLKAKASVLHGHNHQRSTHRENTLNGDYVIVHTTGALCHLDTEYAPLTGPLKHTHGAAIVELKEDKHFVVRNFEIINGEIYY